MRRRRIWLAAALIAAMLWIAAGVTGCGSPATTSGTAHTHTIVDDAGRKVTVPDTVNKVFCTSPVGTIAVYALDPAKLIGWNYELSPAEKSFILPQYRKLPNLGGWYAKATCNVEQVLKIHPDIILSMGYIDATAVSQADKIQKQLDIPVVLVDGHLTKLAHGIDLVGSLLGDKAHAAVLAGYCRQTVDEIAQKAKSIPADRRVTVYYAEGPKGLETDPSGSDHSKLLDFVGAVNVAHVAMKGGMGMSDVSMEQILKWNPDVIISWNDNQGGAYHTILTDADWQALRAVKNQRVYEIPHGPFSWFDRPPSINQIIGVRWLANLLYPNVYRFNIKADARYFYEAFYHYNLTDQELNTLLTGAGVK